MAHPEEPTLPEDTGQRKNKNYTRNTTKLYSTKQVKEYLRMRDNHHPHYLSAFLSRLPCACFTSFAPQKPDLPM